MAFRSRLWKSDRVKGGDSGFCFFVSPFVSPLVPVPSEDINPLYHNFS